MIDACNFDSLPDELILKISMEMMNPSDIQSVFWMRLVSSRIRRVLSDEDIFEQMKNEYKLFKMIGNGKFEYIQNANLKMLYQDAYQVITRLKMWDFLNVKKRIAIQDFDIPEINKIKTKYFASFRRKDCMFMATMKEMQYLILDGESRLVTFFESENLIVKMLYRTWSKAVIG